VYSYWPVMRTCASLNVLRQELSRNIKWLMVEKLIINHAFSRQKITIEMLIAHEKHSQARLCLVARAVKWLTKNSFLGWLSLQVTSDDLAYCVSVIAVNGSHDRSAVIEYCAYVCHCTMRNVARTTIYCQITQSLHLFNKSWKQYFQLSWFSI